MTERLSTLQEWMNERREMGRDIVAVKGRPPEGATYSDGVTPVEGVVNIAWRDTVTGEEYPVEW